MKTDIASKGLDVAQTLATQRVIGYSYTKTKVKKRSVTQENVNIAIQAWELGIVLAGVAVYEYVNGPGSLLGPEGLITTPGLTGNNPLSGVTTLPLTVGLTNPVIL